MSIAFAEKLPEALIKRLYASDRESSGVPTLQPGEREQALDWLRRALVEFDSLDQHIGLLQKLYASPFQYPRPRRDAWNLGQPVEPPPEATFTHADRLDDDNIATILDAGIDSLSDDELASLLLNPVALFDLHDCIDDVQPDYWIDAIHDFVSSRGEPQQSATAQLAKGNGHGYSPLVPPRPTADVSANGPTELSRSLDIALTLSTQLSEILDRNKSTQSRHEWRQPLALAAVVAFFVFGWGVFQHRLTSRSLLVVENHQTELTRLTHELEKTRREFNQLAERSGNQIGLVPTGDAQSRPVDWQSFLNAFYDAKLPDDKNLESLKTHGGEAVRNRISDLQQQTPMLTAHDILKKLFDEWGKPLAGDE